MALALDDFAILRAIGSNPDAFSAISSDIAKQARALLLKQLKAKATDLEKLRLINAALGGDGFALFVEGLKEVDVKSITNRLDKHHPDSKSDDSEWRRRHLIALATGAVAPIEQATRKKSATKKIKPAKEEDLGLTSKAMAAVRRRD